MTFLLSNSTMKSWTNTAVLKQISSSPNLEREVSRSEMTRVLGQPSLTGQVKSAPMPVSPMHGQRRTLLLFYMRLSRTRNKYSGGTRIKETWKQSIPAWPTCRISRNILPFGLPFVYAKDGMLAHSERTKGQVGRASEVRKGHVWFMKHVGHVMMFSRVVSIFWKPKPQM